HSTGRREIEHPVENPRQSPAPSITTALQASPNRPPVRFTLSGRILSRTSVTASTSSTAQNTVHFPHASVGPNASAHAANSAPVRNSTTGYSAEIGVLQFRQRPRNTSQLSSGTLSYGAIGFPHLGQCEGGRTMDSPAGIRRMHTFRKLPTTRPSTKAKATIMLRL